LEPGLPKQAQKDAKKLATSNLKSKAEELLEILKENPLKILHRMKS
jgi:Txe/YoeB family toxin of Txe-Axe toxin-antitoxin module